jgi:hypothetical protein
MVLYGLVEVFHNINKGIKMQKSLRQLSLKSKSLIARPETWAGITPSFHGYNCLPTEGVDM